MCTSTRIRETGECPFSSKNTLLFGGVSYNLKYYDGIITYWYVAKAGKLYAKEKDDFFWRSPVAGQYTIYGKFQENPEHGVYKTRTKQGRDEGETGTDTATRPSRGYHTVAPTRARLQDMACPAENMVLGRNIALFAVAFSTTKRGDELPRHQGTTYTNVIRRTIDQSPSGDWNIDTIER